MKLESVNLQFLKTVKFGCNILKLKVFESRESCDCWCKGSSTVRINIVIPGGNKETNESNFSVRTQHSAV